MSLLRRSAVVVAVTLVAGSVTAVVASQPASAATSPVVSRSHYIRNLTMNTASNATLMNNLGCADSRAGSRYVLLHIGAQSITSPLTSSNPGVLLSNTDTRISYGTLVASVERYLDGFHRCAATRTATVNVATNSDGDFTTYDASMKGIHWATRVVNPIKAYANSAGYSRLSVRGGIDIESGFAATYAQAQEWEVGFLSKNSDTLHFVGSANGCPTTVGATHKACDPGWTQLRYYVLATKSGRVRVLPQIYVTGQATQWANIDATGAKGITFLGALTEHAACPGSGSGCPSGGSFSPTTGWSKLNTALSRIGKSPGNVATDLDIRS